MAMTIEPMDAEQVGGVIADLIADAQSFVEGDSATARKTAADYYAGKPYGDEKPGRSAVVTREVAETVESVLPMLLSPLMEADDLALFQPQGPEDEAAAEQATQYVNFVFQQDNDAFDILYDTLKDGLLRRMGVVKVAWVVERDTTISAYEQLDEASYLQLAGDPDVAVTAHSLRQTATGPVHDVKLRRSTARGRVKIMAVPPAEFLFSPHARSMDDPYLKAHRVTRTVGELIAEGYDRALLDELPADNEDAVSMDGRAFGRQEDGANRRVTIIECYLRLDVDGDGVAERRRIIVAGAARGGVKVLSDEPCEDVPFAAWSPIREPHQVEGFSLADFVTDLQRIKSFTLRGVLDSLNLANHPRIGAVKGQVDLDDLLTSRPGGVVKVSNPNALFPINQPFIGGQTLPVLQTLDGMIERRTGVSNAMQGLDLDALSKGAGHTATGVAALMGAAQQRVALMLRLYAERLLARMFKLILRAVIRHQDAPRVVRLRGKWAPMDPRPWNQDMDLSVGVGLGLADKTQRTIALQQVLTAQKEALQAGGLGGMVTPQHIYATMKRLVELGGLKTADPYFAPPAPPPPGPPPPPQPTADMLVMQEIEGAKIAARAQADAAELAQKERLAMAELALKERLALKELEIKSGRLGVDALKSMNASSPPPPPPHQNCDPAEEMMEARLGG